ncbi:putative entry exclusion protein TrbK-alt [Bradyrhizobium centrolobii]|uniref:putative entry exclusion protein TrbK-alt n=1 Tax=Bradyrhizobium centrolobii TaxID=1505087 RepID=UPI0009EF6A92|nr:putative entry exclusion protein TrbK-alt [Bradyrhizobium centrolobii]
MSMKWFERIPMAVAVTLAVLVVAACAIRLRGDQDQDQGPAAIAQGSDPSDAKLAQCRTVRYEQKDVLLECQKLWAEKRREFFSMGSGSSASRNNAPELRSPSTPPGKDESRLPSPGKDESRLPSGFPPISDRSE